MPTADELLDAARDCAKLELLIQQIEFLALRRYDVLDSGNLRCQRRFLYCRSDNIRGQGQICRLELEAGIFLQRSGRFDGTLHATERINQI